MNYIDPVKYSELLAAFSKGTTKQALRETVDEKKELSPKQKKIAAAAPPEDKITGADFKALKGTKQEGMHLGQPTAPAITTVEGKRDFSKLQPDERKQLKEYIQSMKTIKQEIKKLMEKATVAEGGDTTNLVMTEFGDDDDINIVGDEDAEYDRMQAAHDVRMSGEEELARMMAQQDIGDDEFDDMEQRDREERYRMAGPGREA